MNVTTNTMWYPGKGPDQILPAYATSGLTKRGMESVNLRELGIIPGIAGGAQAHGFHTADDIITHTADGRPLDQVWTDFMALLNAVNTERQALVSFLSVPVPQPLEMVAQPGDGVEMEESSEFGEPTGSRIEPTYFNIGYPFKWYDLGARYSWRYLADATAAMVESVANVAVEAYLRRQLKELFRAIFNNVNTTATIRQQPYTVYRFYNNDGVVPPTYKSNTFLGSHNHYRTSGAATIVAGDLDEMLDDFVSHGYGFENGYRTVIMVHRQEGDTIRGFRSVANGGTGKYDFIPAQGQPGQIMALNQQIIGQSQPANSLAGLNVIGSYGNATIVQDDWMPVGYIVGFVTGGRDNLSNPVGLRQHANANLRGLRLVKGRTPNYPLIDSFWTAGYGFGVRHRGAGMVMQITAAGAYTIPAAYA
jgi:hypothetical protein